MKKNFKFYLVCWILLFAFFNAAAFIAPSWLTLEKYTPSFWIGYSFITASFIGQLACSWVTFNENDVKKLFYKISLISISYIGLISSAVVGIIFMIIGILPYWIGAIVCPLVLVFNVISILKAHLACEIVSDIDKKNEQKTTPINEIKTLSEDLLFRANSEAEKAMCKEIRDAIKYSDPMSVDELKDIEIAILNHLALFKQAMMDGQFENLNAEKVELLALIAERNNKCKVLK